MDNTTQNNNNEVEIDLQRLLNMLLSKSWIIAIAAVVCAVAMFLGTFFFVTPMYQSSAKFYANNATLSSLSDLTKVTASDISASRGLVDTYLVILNTRETLTDVIDYAGLNRSVGSLKGMLSAASVNDTEIFQIVVTGPDAEETQRIADAVSYILPNRIKSIIDGSSIKIVEAAVVPSSPVSPNYTRNTVMGFLLGAIAMAAILVLIDLMDVTIRETEDLLQNCKYPLLSTVPNVESKSKSGSKKETDKSRATAQPKPIVGQGISFAATEAYKVLRTKIQFSFAADGGCRVIGVSSAMAGEGKSVTAINLAYALAQLGERVLLIDCDMRCPSVSEKLPVAKSPGLSDYLAGQAHGDNLLQPCGIKDDQYAFHVISAGRTPPNPMELLSSSKMEKMIALFRERYDYIIFDLPPVGEVGDALAVTKLTDGVLLVVRQNYCNRLALNYATNQFEFVGAKILGAVFNSTNDRGSTYGYRKKYYKSLYKSYYGAKNPYAPKNPNQKA